METKNDMAAKIKDLRLKKNWMQGDLAKAAGVSRYTVIKIESGHAPNIKILERIAAALGMPAAYFLG